MIKKLFILPFVFISLKGIAQTIVTEQQAVDSVIKNYPSMQIADLKVQQGKTKQKSSVNLPNPEMVVESPSAEFYTIGVLQQIEFPTVYSKQLQLAKQQTTLFEKEKVLTVLEIKYQIRTLYLNFQYAASILELLRLQDSIYADLSKIADRKFEAGEIDFISKTYTNSQYGEVHARYFSEKANLQSYSGQLKLYMNMTDSIAPVTITKSTLNMPVVFNDSASLENNPVIQYYNQSVNVNESALKLEKNKALPGIVFGYLNQGPDYTPVNLRFRAGLTIPLWFWQYSANIKAAKYSYEIAKEEKNLNKQILLRNTEFLKQQLYSSALNLNYYENKGMKQADELFDASKRYFDAGEWDNISFLRTSNDAFDIKANYYLTLKTYNELLLQYHFLNGSL